MVKVRKAVIPAGGFGTGFLPATKASPKELLPIVDKPMIQFIVEEAIESGIEEILIITGRHKRPIEDHFDSNVELEENLESKGKHELLKIVQSTTRPNIFYVRQSYPNGLGDAIYHAKAFVGDEPFAVMLGDNIMDSEVPVMKQLIDLYEETGTPNLAVTRVKESKVNQYGVIEVSRMAPGTSEEIFHVLKFVEKPRIEDAPSNLAIAGRYVLPPKIFEILEDLGVNSGATSIQLTDAIDELNKTQRVFAKCIEGERFDVGNLEGYMEMSLHYGLEHPETASGLKDYLINLGKQLESGEYKNYFN